MKNQFMLKNFYKNKSVILTIHYPDHRVKTIWRLPNVDDKKTASYDNCRYLIDTETEYFSLSNGVPLFTYKYNEIKPMNVLKDVISATTSEEFEKTSNNTFFKQMHDAQTKGSDINWSMYALLAIIAVGGILIYLMTKGGAV
jgi:hypothetical protein